MERMNYSDYTESYIAFIDILGFSEKIKRISTEKDFHEISQLLSVIKETAEYYTKENQYLDHFQVTAISDSIIISVPVNRNKYSLIIMIQLLLAFQYDLLILKNPIRGRISGKSIYQKNLVFSLFMARI